MTTASGSAATGPVGAPGTGTGTPAAPPSNATIAISQWDRCMNISKDRVALKSAFQKLSKEEQIAYCSEKGNIVPVIKELEKTRNEKRQRTQKLANEINEYLKANKTLDERISAHDVPSQIAGDRSDVEATRQMCASVLAELRITCYADTDLAARLAHNVPFAFRPVPNTASAYIFRRLITDPTTNDGGYTADETARVIENLSKDLSNLQTTKELLDLDIQGLQQRLSEASASISTLEDTNRLQMRIENELKIDLNGQKNRVHDLRTELDDTRIGHAAELSSLRIDRNTAVLERDDIAVRLDTTTLRLETAKEQLESTTSDLTKANEAFERVQKRLEEAQEMTSTGVTDFTKYLNSYQATIKRLEGEAVGRDGELQNLLKESERTAERVEGEKQELIAAWQTKLQTELVEREGELNEEWSSKLNLAVRELEQERERLENDRRDHQNTLNQLNASWSQALSRVLVNAVTGEDIPSDHVYLFLPETFSSLNKFGFRSMGEYVFAEVYTGCQDTTQVPNDDLRMVDIICWIKGFSVPSRLPSDATTRIVWLEKHLLEQIRGLQKRDTWVLLAYHHLSLLVLSADWPTCCIAIVRLAVLSNQYPMRDTDRWNKLVADLMNDFKELDIDPLAQACFAYLSLTTSDPQATMASNLPESLSQADFNITTRIPELLSKLVAGSQDVALGISDNSTAVVIVRRRHQEVIFAKFTDGWSFSLQSIDVSVPQQEHRKYTHRTLTWGERAEQTADVKRGSSMWRYIDRHHGALADRAAQDLHSEVNASIASLQERLRQPFALLHG